MLLYLFYGGMPTITHHIYYYYYHHHLSILFHLRYSLLIMILLFSVLHLCMGLDFPSHLFSHIFIWYLLMIYEVLRSTPLCDNLRSMRSPMIYFARWNKKGNQYLKNWVWFWFIRVIMVCPWCLFRIELTNVKIMQIETLKINDL